MGQNQHIKKIQMSRSQIVGPGHRLENDFFGALPVLLLGGGERHQGLRQRQRQREYC